jgi:hypothetical protein
MDRIRWNSFWNLKKTLAQLSFAALALFALAGSSFSQERGPLPPPPPGTIVPPPAARPQAGPQHTASPITSDAPPIPVEEIIARFTKNEEEFRRERDNFTYTQTVRLQTIDEDGQPDGEFYQKSDIIFTPSGKRIEHVTEAPVTTLTRILMEQQDYDDIEKVWPLVLTPDELPRYDVKYVGKEQVDELNTYIFDIKPKQFEKKLRYFEGRVWVEDHDFQIVKTQGIGTGLRKKNSDSAYPHFETFRENIEGRFWFPTFTRADDTLHFKANDVRVHVTVRYENYKRFGSTIKIGKATEIDPGKSEKPDKQEKP